MKMLAGADCLLAIFLRLAIRRQNVPFARLNLTLFRLVSVGLYLEAKLSSINWR